MPWRLNSASSGFESEFARFLVSRESISKDVSATVSGIIADIRARGDEALLDYTRRFDHQEAVQAGIKVSASELDEAEKNCPADVRSALELAAQRIRDYSEKQLPADLDYTDATGAKLGWRWSAIDAVGMYVPGGLASYPSSVLMNAVPACVAGVQRLVMVVPAPGGVINPAVLTAARIAGVDEIYRIGGAQAVAVLAYGTATIQPVDKIIGPGNAYVAEAKRQVFGRVGIDMIAGPSEIVVVADARSDPRWVATDLLSQAEHDADAQAVLITESAALAEAVEKDIAHFLTTLSKGNIAAQSWEKHGAVIVVKSLDESVALVDRLAPEHVEFCVDAPERLTDRVRHAGAIFIGRHTPEAIGDYVAGPSHVLPTFRTARFSSGLSVLDFMKRTSLLSMNEAALSAVGPAAYRLAQAEGLTAHALSVQVRIEHE